MIMGDIGGVYLVTFFQMLPPSAFFLGNKQKADGCMDVWMDGCMDGCMDGYLIPVNCRAPCGANKIKNNLNFHHSCTIFLELTFSTLKHLSSAMLLTSLHNISLITNFNNVWFHLS